MPTRRRRATFRSSSPGVERFNYAKALLRSDHELEKLSRKIRSEINESELFELAQAAEKAADLGVDNFSGRASTFGELQKQKQQEEELAKTKTGLHVAENWKVSIGDDKLRRQSPARMPRLNRLKPSQLRGVENNGSEKSDGSNQIGFSDQSLLEHARAAAAVVVASPAVQVRMQRLKEMRKEPEKRSMRIESLRDVNEVIPLWKELHGHMRTHFHRANVKTNCLFFNEREPSPSASNISTATKKIFSSISIETKGNTKATNHQRRKSFFDNIAGIKLLPDFGSKKPQHEKVEKSHSDDETDGHEASKTTKSDSPEAGEYGAILSSHISPKNKDFGNLESPSLCVPPGLAHPDEYNYTCESHVRGASPKVENGDNQEVQATSLTPRLPTNPESFDLEVMQITKKVPASPMRCNDICDNDNGDNQKHCVQSAKDLNLGYHTDSQNEDIEAKSIVSSPKGKRESSTSSPDYESVCPVSPSNDSIIHQFNPRFAGPSSPTTPSTPISSVISRSKDSGFSTPAHLRMIKRLHSGVSDVRSSRSNSCLEQPKFEDAKDFQLQDDDYAATPAPDVYSQFEPNSIIQKSPRRSPHVLATPSLQYVETTHLALPTIQSSKSEDEERKISTNFVRRKLRTRWQDGSVSPPNSPPDSSKSKDKNDFDGDAPSSEAAKIELETPRTQSESKEHAAAEESTALQLPPVKPSASTMPTKFNENSVPSIDYDKAVDEKKECDSAISSLDPDSRKDKSQLVTIGQNELFRNGGEEEGHLRSGQSFSSSDTEEETSFLLQDIDRSKLIPRMKSWEKESSTTTKASHKIDSRHSTRTSTFLSINAIQKHDVLNAFNHADDARNGDNISVCHSLPSTDVTFKAAVQTVQGVAVQTVQEVFSHLSLGSPKNQLQSKEWQSEGDNKEFLSNYFYCAKATRGNEFRRTHAIQNIDEELNPSVTDVEGLACTEPCNGKDSPCYLFGIDTMCGGLIDLLPDDNDATSIERSQRRHDVNGDFSHATTRDRSSSISTGQIHRNRLHSQSAMNSYQNQDEGTWIGMFQKAASERFNFQFHAEQNELGKHPYTPPCLSRKVPTQNQTL
jgi:hypothetical protein